MHIPNPAWGTELITYLYAGTHASNKYIVLRHGAKGRLMHLCRIQENQQRKEEAAAKQLNTLKIKSSGFKQKYLL